VRVFDVSTGQCVYIGPDRAGLHDARREGLSLAEQDGLEWKCGLPNGMTFRRRSLSPPPTAL